MKFVVFSLGCRVNQYEGQSMIGKLCELGYEATDRLEEADCYVLNTCSVTSEADKKSRQAVARVKKLNPRAQVFVVGCSSQNNGKPFLEKDGVRLVGGVGGKMEILNEILAVLSQNDSKIEKILPLPKVYEDDLTPMLTNSRAYVKVQDGCNNFCSYCIIPYLRGRSRSRALESIVREVEALCGKTKEVVITGIDVSSYGKDIGLTLTDLVRALAPFPIRKRFGSLEVGVVDEGFLTAMKESGFCDSFHLSMQSGCDKTLKDMNRHYTAKQFLDKVSLIRSVFPSAGVSTDVIAGFPGETEEDFEQTLRTCRQAKFLQMHVFPYSERKGTKAANQIQVAKSIRMDRAARLIALGDEMKKEFLRSQEGRDLEVFVEEKDGDRNVGYTDNFVKVYTTAPIGSFLTHRIKGLYGDGVEGEVL